MKNALFLFSILSLTFNATAQSPSALQSQFLEQLNSVLRSSPQHHWAFEGEKMKVDSPFAVDKNGMLSVTLQYSTDSTNYKVRYTAPLNTITRVVWDIYLILEYKSDAVTAFKKSGTNEWEEILTRNYFHIGIVGEDPRPVENVRHILSLLLNDKELAPEEYFFRDYGVDDKSYSEGLKAVDRNDKYGFINLKREIAISFQFDEARDFVEGLAAVKKNGKWGFINVQGQVVIPYIYKNVFDFENGKAQVYLKNKWMHIDRSGKAVKP